MPGGSAGGAAVVVEGVVALLKFSSGDAVSALATGLSDVWVTVGSGFLHPAKATSRQLITQVIFRRFNLMLQLTGHN